LNQVSVSGVRDSPDDIWEQPFNVSFTCGGVRVGETAHRSEANVDGRGSEILLLQKDSISKNNGSIEGKARF
jgi:hypothetical protein